MVKTQISQLQPSAQPALNVLLNALHSNICFFELQFNN